MPGVPRFLFEQLRRVLVVALVGAIVLLMLQAHDTRARAIHVDVIPSDAVFQQIIYCGLNDRNCADVWTGKRYARPPSRPNRRLGCRWVTTGYSTGLGVYKYFCIIRHGVALGSASFAPTGIGFGTAHPDEIFNGGDPSGHATKIRWHGWGAGVATGSGLNAIFKPGGGYYSKLARIEFRATRIRRCSRTGPRAYMHLSARVPNYPGGPLGPWFSWAGARSIC